MPNGRPHDNPISDILIHGMHPFPPELEALVLELEKLDSWIFNELEWEPFEWERGKHLEEARELLEALIRSHGDPNARREHIAAYRAKTRTAK